MNMRVHVHVYVCLYARNNLVTLMEVWQLTNRFPWLLAACSSGSAIVSSRSFASVPAQMWCCWGRLEIGYPTILVCDIYAVWLVVQQLSSYNWPSAIGCHQRQQSSVYTVTFTCNACVMPNNLVIYEVSVRCLGNKFAYCIIIWPEDSVGYKTSILIHDTILLVYVHYHRQCACMPGSFWS